jgi:cation/acetate symporter
MLPADAPISINSPALISIPVSFLALIIVSLMTKKQPDYIRDGAEA